MAAAVEAGVAVGPPADSAMRGDFVTLGEADGFRRTSASRLVLELQDGLRAPSAAAMLRSFGVSRARPADG